jgi:YD repeat-containing protein
MASRSWSAGPAALTYAYDGAKRPISETSGSAIGIGRTYDSAGNVTSEAQTIAGADASQNGTQTFEYDALNRVTSGTLGSTIKTYSYDSDGNRLTVTVNGVATDNFIFDATDETISDTVGSVPHAFIYDRYGNLLSSGTGAAVSTTTYGYDLADRLNSITAPDGSIVGFTFDAPGRHATRTGTTAGVTTTIDTI